MTGVNMSQGTSGAPSKRKRVEEATSEPYDGFVAAGTTRSSEMWLEDGNIVIEADKTQFKVHRSLLSAHSPVFKDMFSIPQGPASAEEPTVEGCPVVHLSDSAVDVAIVLRALFLRGHVTISKPVTIDIVAAFIRMGKKYEIESLRVEGLQRLFYEFPVSLKDQDGRGDYSRITGEESMEFDAAMLAREQTLSSVLPVALLLCSTSSVKEIIEGIPRTDGTFAKFSPNEIITSLYTRERLAQLQFETTFSWIDASDWTYNACPTPKNCGEVRTHFLRCLFLPTVQIVGLAKWPGSYQLGDGRSMCKSCKMVAKAMHDSGREEFWEALPGVFDLPGWDELRKEREELAENHEDAECAIRSIP